MGFCVSSSWAQNITLTSTDSHSTIIELEHELQTTNTFEISLENVLISLQNTPNYNTERNQRGTSIELQLPDGTPFMVDVHEAPVSHLDHYSKYPQNKTYKITGGSDQYISGRLAISPRGVRGLIYTDSKTVFIESVHGGEHISYYYTKTKGFGCDADMSEYRPAQHSQERSSTSIGDQITDYDIAIASSGEWSNERNNDLVVINDDINTYLTELNAIYEKEVAITFTLIADNDDLIFFDPATDGLDENNRTASAHSTISGIIPSSDYDIGHVFFEIAYSGSGAVGSGVAGLGVVCNSSRKAEGWTGAGGNYNTAIFMDIFAHEVAHQFNAAHSFYGTSNFCSGFNRSPGSGYEPGSGNTMMSYEGICQANGACTETHNITPISNTVYFHAHSVEEILDYTDIWTCGNTSSSTNTPPVVTVPSNKFIPTSTPFEVSGSGTDANGDPLVYTWEEYDSDFLILSCPDGHPDDAATSTTAPLFRSFDPSSDGNYRSFPQISDILNNEQTLGEILPTIGRDIKLRLTARDFNSSAGGVDCDDVTLTVDGNSGPFEVTIANDPNPAFQSGESVTITWDVNNTASSPINCNNVEILFSTDGGMTFPTTLAASTTNDGSHTVTMPTNGTTEGRIKIKAIDNYFFDINNEDITIISDCEIVGGEIINSESITEDAGDPALDLALSTGLAITQMSGTLESSGTNTNLNCENLNTGGCVSFTNSPKFETLEFTVDETGDYTFTRSSSYLSIINIYEISYDNSSVCTNWLSSSATWNPSTGGLSIGSSVTENLTAGNIYVIKFSGFSTSNTGAFTVSFSNSVSGSIYDTNATAPAGYSVNYVVVDGSNNIVGIDSGPDMTDDNTYSGGAYTVYGLSYISSTDLSSYVGGSYSALESDVLNGTVCGDFTSNSKSVTVNGCTPGTKTITNTNNSGTGSLRNMIADACPGDLIVFSSSIPNNSTVTLSTEIIIDKMLTVDASDVDNLSLSGGFTSRIFQIPNGVSVSLKNMNLISGFASNNGGAFYNLGQVKLGDIVFENNFDGGSIAPYTGGGEIIIESGEVLIKD